MESTSRPTRRLAIAAALLLGLSAPRAAADAAAAPAPAGAITLGDALAAALRGNPALAAAAATIRVEEARALAADVLPNPELAVDVENLGGSGDRQSFETTETTLFVSQRFELGGKRARRQRLAVLERDAAAWDLAIRRADVLTATTQAFIGVLALQQRVALGGDLVRLAAQLATSVEAQVRAGAGAPAESARARIAVAAAELERAQLGHALAAARVALASAWGSATPEFERVVGDLTPIAPPPPLAALRGRLATAPELARWETERSARAASLAVAQAAAIPDLVLGAGPRFFSDNGDVALVLGVGIPLPLFDRNQGAVAAARAQLARGAAEQQSAEAAAQAALARACEMLHAAYARIAALGDTMIPAAEAALAASRDAYRRGALRSLDVLDAQRTLFALRDQSIEARAAYHHARADVDRLTGADLAATLEEAP